MTQELVYNQKYFKNYKNGKDKQIYKNKEK